jgi:hypothetical protein
MQGVKGVACAAMMAAVLVPAAGRGATTAPAAADTAPAEPSLAAMTKGFTYYNRPGADLKVHDAEVADCAAEAARTISVDEQIHNGSSMGLLGALIGGAMQNAYHRGAAAAGLENCMVVRGWRVVRVPDAEGQELAKLPAADLSARMGPWVGAETPHGDVVRTFGNEAANSSVVRFAIRPSHSNDGQLSLTEATGGNLHQFAQAPTPPASARDVLDPKWPKKPLTTETLAAAPDGAAVIMVQIKGVSGRNGIGVLLNRRGSDKDVFPSRLDHAPDLIQAQKGWMVAHKECDMFAFAAPPGQWRVAGLAAGLPILNFCLGAPAFEVKAGEVVYAGSFDLSAPDLGPDLDLAPVRKWMGASPRGAAARAAAYVNGVRGLCGNNAIYALEVKGAPFEAGYAWGGALPARAPAAGQASSGAASPSLAPAGQASGAPS